ncbi:TIGR04283 family arsenosugar biosynthesis glycosyltransferase [Endozoicomonas sp. SM1973]|uniref:TIGR04283 family arsenosugar biosynthesis glycosyltransferase n=1 Tax=Spartinivicinus marinus TaxID=2994442 RepID=A0A853IAA8_9GAMM|nr:TIGR04283 family arsenosugar biosynthesis glycosyltransferase [Spartinivicinus marinus]MCX4024781.1 TIGR04283 family arsenosugar biosynthesis glycosyltransferase [Spartinivicinus marinus]NYZ68732.1 TIGR04283 family arsenosugar biosynthesis glycosyltransferase [Spartinivicinus marinus]
MKCSIIIPTLNESDDIVASLTPLQALRQNGHEIIIVDGGSTDNTVALAKPWVNQVISSGPGRARQMQIGAEQSTGDVLLFLHADTFLPGNAITLIHDGLGQANSWQWGRFDVTLSGNHWLLALTAKLMSWRSRLTGIATGDQAIFVRRECFMQVGGYRLMPLMEDVDICKRLKKISKPLCIVNPVVTSSRRWEQRGIIRTILLMWSLRLAFFMGVSPQRLVNIYYPRNKIEND